MRSKAMFLILLPLLTFACSCASTPALVATHTIARADILERDMAWLEDSTLVLRFNTPYVYGAWRLEVEACSGLARAGWPRFYVAPFNPIVMDGETRMASYIPGAQSIVFALGNESVKAVVMHELLHWLLEPIMGRDPHNETSEARRIRQHPPEYFKKRCGSLFAGTI